MKEVFPAYLQQIQSIFQSQIESPVIHDGGDDFLVIEINSAWIFRFPRNAASQKALEKEMRFLSKFKAFSPLKIPDYRYAGEHFAGYKKIQGSPLTEELFQSLSKSVQKEIAQKIGMFLSALHNFPIEDAAELGIPEAWGGLHFKNGAVFLERVAPLLSPSVRKKSTRLMEDLLAEIFDVKVIHGDFYFPDHVFFDKSQSDLGVIDFGDVTIYDPAHDFQAVIEIGGEEFFESVRQNYQGGYDPGLLKRSKARLIARPLFVAGYVFANGLEEQYSSRVERIEELFS